MKNRLEKIRTERGLSQAELGRRSGVTQAYISQLEADPGRTPGVDIAAELAKALNVAPLQLFPRLPRGEKEDRWTFFQQVYPELVGVLNDVDRLRLYVAVSCMDEPGFLAMTSILNPSPLRWHQVRENLLVRLKLLVRDAQLCEFMEDAGVGS